MIPACRIASTQRRITIKISGVPAIRNVPHDTAAVAIYVMHIIVTPVVVIPVSTLSGVV